VSELIRKTSLYLREAIASETSAAISTLLTLLLSVICLVAFVAKRVL